MCKISQFITFIIFAVLAGGHWLSFFMKYVVTFNDFTVPVIWSLPAALLFTFMALWAAWGYKCYCKCCKVEKK